MGKFGIAAAGAVLLVVAGTAGGTGALWHDNAALSPGTVTTGSLELLAGGTPESYVFTTLSTDNLAPGASVSAPLALRNGGSAEMLYQLADVATATSTAADSLLAAALTLIVTDDPVCNGTAPESVDTFYRGPLTGGAFAGSRLAPSSAVDLCITVELSADAPIEASQGTTAATFTFRGDQVQ